MNRITEIFNSISEIELKNAIIEIKESNDSGIIPVDGYVRKYANLIREISGNDLNLFASKINLLEEASFRWVFK